MPMQKFKSGDRVECLTAYHQRLTKGEIYTVDRVVGSGRGELLYIDGLGHFAHRFRKVEDVPTFRIGQRIRAVKAYPNWFDAGDIFTLDNYFASSATPISIICPKHGNSLGAFQAQYFEPIDESKFITLSGEIDGNMLVVGEHRIQLPTELLPVSEEFVKQRKLAAEIIRKIGGAAVRARRVENGEFDSRVKEIFDAAE